MIYFLTTQGHAYTIGTYLNTWGTALRSRIQPLAYEEFQTRKSIPLGRYIFSDLERLTPSGTQLAEAIWRALSEPGRGVRPLNRPNRCMRRYELLRTLFERGHNRFNVYRLTEARSPQRFPVFLRNENDHEGSLSGLIASFGELDTELTRMLEQGIPREDKIITEYCDVSDKDGVFVKYGAFRVGDRIIPRHRFRGRQWIQKEPELRDEETEEAERRYLTENPHESELREIFDLARIDYGRIDYGMVDGRIQVWEINTNPMLFMAHSVTGTSRRWSHAFFAERVSEAFLALDQV